MKTNSLFEKLDKTLSPIGAKIGNQIHLKAVSTGMMLTLPMIVIGSLFITWPCANATFPCTSFSGNVCGDRVVTPSISIVDNVI